MKKKLVMATLCITLSAMALAGCGGSDDTKEKETKAVTTEKQTEAETETEVETETETETELTKTANATKADAEEATTPDATEANAEEATAPEATKADAEEATTPDATAPDAEEATAPDATAADATPVEYTAPDGAFHMTLPSNDWQETIVQEGVQMYLTAGDEQAIFITHGLEAGLADVMILDQNPDTKEAFEEAMKAQNTEGYTIEVLDYQKDMGEDLEVVSAYIEYSAENQESFYNISYVVASENEAYVLSAISYTDREEADQLYDAVLSFEFEKQELPATPADATMGDAEEVETESETETEVETESETESETETEVETEVETESETEAEVETELETEAEKTVVYEAEDGSFTITLPDDTWKDKTQGSKVTFTSENNSLTVEGLSVKEAEEQMDLYPATAEEFEKKTGWNVVKYQNESMGEWEFVSVCWKEKSSNAHSVVYYLRNEDTAYVLNGVAADKDTAEAVYTSALSFKNIEK